MGLPHNHEDDIKLRILLLLDIHRAACITLLLHFSFKTALIQARLRRLTSLEMRLQIIEVEHDCTLLNDTYIKDLHSPEILLGYLGHHALGEHRRCALCPLWLKMIESQSRKES